MDMEKDHPGPKYFKKDHFTSYPILMRLLGVIIVIPPAINFWGKTYFSHCPSSPSGHISRTVHPFFLSIFLVSLTPKLMEGNRGRNISRETISSEGSRCIPPW